MLEPTFAHSSRARFWGYALELASFTYKNAASCVFPVAIFALLALSRVVDLPIARYDVLLIAVVWAFKR